MPSALRHDCQFQRHSIQAIHTLAGSPRRTEVEAFIRASFAQHYNASIPVLAPNLMFLDEDGRILAAAGWRAAGLQPLYLERYLDQPIEKAVARLAGQPVSRERIVEVGNLAAGRPGSGINVIRALARDLDRQGFEWVVFTATRALVGIFARLGLPLLTLGVADPARLGPEALAWGSYYETGPIVVAGRIRLALGRAARHE